MAAPVVDALGHHDSLPGRDPGGVHHAAGRLAAGDPAVDQVEPGAGDAVQRGRDGRGADAQAEEPPARMTALIALLGGVRATVFASALLAALAWGSVQTHRLGNAQEDAESAEKRATEAEIRIDGFQALLVRVNAEADRQLAESKAQALAGEVAVTRAEERTEERRVGKECGSTCRTRGAP